MAISYSLPITEVTLVAEGEWWKEPLPLGIVMIALARPGWSDIEHYLVINDGSGDSLSHKLITTHTANFIRGRIEYDKKSDKGTG